jgi:hypothetical protein
MTEDSGSPAQPPGIFDSGHRTPLVRLAYVAMFLIALIAEFVLWSEVAGQGHLDLLPWHIKLFLGVGAAFAFVRTAAAAVDSPKTWNRATLAWSATLLALLIACGLAAYWAHVYLEDEAYGDEGDESSPAAVAPVVLRAPWLPPSLPAQKPVA